MRGRKRKPDAFDWLRLPPEWISDFDGNNLSTPEAIEASRQIHEFHRRLRVGESVTQAYEDGRNTANSYRRKSKVIAEWRVINDNQGIMGKRGLSASAVARVIIAKGEHHGLGPRALRDLVRRTQKLAGPNTA